MVKNRSNLQEQIMQEHTCIILWRQHQNNTIFQHRQKQQYNYNNAHRIPKGRHITGRGKQYVNQIVEILADTDQEQHNDTN